MGRGSTSFPQFSHTESWSLWHPASLATGENPKVVSGRLGHTKVAFTLDRYGHVLPGMQEKAAAKLEAILFGR